MRVRILRVRSFLFLFLAVVLSSCSADHVPEKMETVAREHRKTKELEKLFGDEALKFGGIKKRNQEDSGICVNSYLWRASLDTVAFMPIASADPFGGVILTDWYSPTSTPNERFKINIFILNRQLRSDGLRVSLFRQEKNSSGEWVDQPVDSEVVMELENAIFTRARHFRSRAVK